MSKTAYNISLKGCVGGADFDRKTVDNLLEAQSGKEVNLLIDSLDGSLAIGLSISAGGAENVRDLTNSLKRAPVGRLRCRRPIFGIITLF